MKKLSILFLILVIGGTLSAYSFSKKESPSKRENIQTQSNGPSKFLDIYSKSDWLNKLNNLEWEEINKSDETYSYNFKPGGKEARKTVSYQKNANGRYEGIMEIVLDKSSDKYVLEIPKAFASHVDQLDFSVEPSAIINPDPIVEFNNTDEEIEIKSMETKTQAEIESSIEEQIIDAESKRCESLEEKEHLACALSLIAKYRDTEYLKNELKNMNMAEFMGGVFQAVRSSDLKTCDYIGDTNDRTLCYEYAYQTLVKDCDSRSGPAYRTCIRDLSSKLPSYKEQRLFCGYIEDEAMRAECQGTAPLEVCDEIENEEQKNLCKINIVRTNNDIDSCEKFDNDEYKQVCLAVVGIGQNNTKHCDKIEDDYLSGLCRTKIAINNDDQAVCENIKDLAAKDLCLGGFLTKEKNINQELCDSFNELFLKETCELGLAVLGNDPSKCADSSIISLENQAICYMGIAMKHQDPSVCEKIQPYNEYDQDAVLELKEKCLKIGGDKPTETVVKNDQTEKREVKLSDYPAIPDWMNCPTPEGAILKNIGGGQTSGFYYYSPETRGQVGLRMSWWGEGFDQPYQFICYNAEGKKDGPFKFWTQSGSLQKEGAFKDGEFHGVIKTYSNDTIRTLHTYENGKLNGYFEGYCSTKQSCQAGTLLQTGYYKNGQKNGSWNTYESGEFKYRQEFVNGEVTRDDTGMSLKYYSE